jgi:UMF1 family MFS transporter
MNKKIAYWALYDFANSILLMAFLFYFSQWLVIDQGKPAWWYNLSLVLASVLFILTTPFLSKKIDESKNKISGLRIWTFLSLVSSTGVALMAMMTNGFELWAAILYSFSTYAYLTCFLYYTPMLNDISLKESRSWVSGIGQGANNLGQVFGILVTLPFVNGITLFGEGGRAQALLPAVFLFAIFSLPMLILYKEEKSTQAVQDGPSEVNIFSLFRSVFAHRSLDFILIAYFLFSDSLLTFANNFPLYLEVVFKTSNTVKSILTASILVLACFGAILFGKVSDKTGNVRILKIIIFAWCALLVLMSLSINFNFVVIICLIAGFLFGPIFSITRSLVGQLAPDHLVASSYSYYVLAERFATFIGPAVWSGTLLIAGETAKGYRTGLFSLAVLLLFSLFALNKVAEPVRN